MRFLFICLVFFCVSTNLFAQKNVILIIADDLGSDYCGFYENHVDTVNLPNAAFVFPIVKKDDDDD